MCSRIFLLRLHAQTSKIPNESMILHQDILVINFAYGVYKSLHWEDVYKEDVYKKLVPNMIMPEPLDEKAINFQFDFFTNEIIFSALKTI